MKKAVPLCTLYREIGGGGRRVPKVAPGWVLTDGVSWWYPYCTCPGLVIPILYLARLRHTVLFPGMAFTGLCTRPGLTGLYTQAGPRRHVWP